MPSRQFSSPAWFWKQLCQNWTLSTKCFDVDESVNSNKNLFSQNFSDQLYFPFCQAYLLILRLSVWLQAKVFCHGHPGCRVQAQLNASSCPPGSSPSMSLWERSSMQQHSSLPPSPSISQLHPDPCRSRGFVVGTKVPSPPFYSIITPEKVKHREITTVTAALKV